jgi:uncharacterized protein
MMTDSSVLSSGVTPAMRTEISAHLAQLEQDLNIRVLYAAESGSRAWGFASPNSDYDVRFLYVPTPAWYVSVKPQRDVIERMLPNDIDLSGWELRKALRLFQRYNGALNEWLDSPIQYRTQGASADQLRQLLPQFFKPAAALHHYGSMANTALSAMPINAPVSSKKLCYLLRALFACRHILATKTQAPTQFHTLLLAHSNSAAERSWIEQMLHAKALAPEKALTQLGASRRAGYAEEIEAALAARASIGGAQRTPAGMLDEILRSAVLQLG